MAKTEESAKKCVCGFGVGVDGRFVPRWVEKSVKLYAERNGLSIRMILTESSIRRDLPPKTRRELERALNSPIGAGMKKRGELIWPVFNECPVHPKRIRAEVGRAIEVGGGNS